MDACSKPHAAPGYLTTSYCVRLWQPGSPSRSLSFLRLPFHLGNFLSRGVLGKAVLAQQIFQPLNHILL